MMYAIEQENIQAAILQLGLHATLPTSISLPTPKLCVLNTD